MSITHKRTVSVIPGDGIGPEVAGSAIRLMEAAGVPLQWEWCEAGAAAFAKGISTGVPQETLDSLARNKVALKGPLETPVGFGGKSANVTLRMMFEMYANIRPVRELPNVFTPFSGRNINFVVVRENVEDLYAGIEYMATPTVAQALKLISHKGCEKIIRFAFELARAERRKSVHCATKANILKLTEGMMKRVFEEVSRDYPDIDAKHIIIDNCAHQLMIHPEQFEVIVTTNLHGDILSDQAAGLVGGLGIAPSANIGNEVAMFESVHGSAPEIAGQNKANPLAFIGASVMMLRHLGLFEHAEMLENSMLLTLAQDHKTADLRPRIPALSTKDFTNTLIHNLGKPYQPENSVRAYRRLQLPIVGKGDEGVPSAPRSVCGVDVFIENHASIQTLGKQMEELASTCGARLKMISSRGSQVYPNLPADVDLVDHRRLRFLFDAKPEHAEKVILTILQKLTDHAISWTSMEKLHLTQAGALDYTLAQGEEQEQSGNALLPTLPKPQLKVAR
jgi:isocitrate dehydrogenase